MIHVKKVLPEYFEALHDGSKRFELRREDPAEPAYVVGDYLAVNEIQAPGAAPTGRCLLFRITYVLRDVEWLSSGCAALGLQLAPLSFDDLPHKPQLQPMHL